MNEIATTERSNMNAVAISAGPSGSSIAPQNLGEVVRFAEVMCRADIALPKHLRDNAGACMAVALQALQWEMNPFAVASKSYSVNGIIAYEAQLIAAVVNTRSGIKGRLKYEYFEDGAEMWCRVSGTLDGEVCTYDSPPVSAITPKNSPLWKTDQRQQLGYYSARSWARRHCPEVLLGIYDREEASSIGPENARDVTPSVMTRLQQRTEAPQQREGFDPGFVTRETAALTGEPDSGQSKDDSSSADASPADGSDGAKIQPRDTVAATESASQGDEEEGATSETSKADHGGQPVPSSTYSRADCVRAFMNTATNAELSVTDRRQLLADMKDLWKDALASDLDFVRACLQTSDKVCKGELVEDAARKFLEALP